MHINDRTLLTEMKDDLNNEVLCYFNWEVILTNCRCQISPGWSVDLVECQSNSPGEFLKNKLIFFEEIKNTWNS